MRGKKLGGLNGYLGVTFSFLIVSPMINEVEVVILAGILGWKLATLSVVAGLLVAWFGGIAMQTFRPVRWVEDNVWKIRMGRHRRSSRIGVSYER